MDYLAIALDLAIGGGGGRDPLTPPGYGPDISFFVQDASYIMGTQSHIRTHVL